jgi:serine/threonine-protein kinase
VTTVFAQSEARSRRYRPVAAIGRGGMAEVLLSLMEAGAGVRKVAVLKRIWPDLASDGAFVAMFHDEARLAIRLNHPNVVQTNEVIEDQGQLAIAMEYLHGQTLTAVLNRLGGPRELNLQLRLRIVADILAGLHYAHELTDYGGAPLNVVHRDVSPHNVFVTYDGQVKLMDFGVAKAEAAGQRTRPGGIAGKLAYLAPEYLRNDHAIDRRADVFSVGVMLWELLSGRRVWQGKADAEIVHLLATGRQMPDLPPDPNRPPVLAGIVARALAVNPAERYASAGELEIDLRNVMIGAADSHARTLGRVVSNAFASARSEREAMIARALVTGRAMGVQQPDWARDPGWARTIDQFLSTADELLDVTVVDESNVISESPVVSAAARFALAPIAKPRLRQPPPPPPPLPAARRRARYGLSLGGAAVGGAAVAALLAVVVAKAPLGASPPPARSASAAVTTASIVPLPAETCSTSATPAAAPAAAPIPAAAPVPIPVAAAASIPAVTTAPIAAPPASIPATPPAPTALPPPPPVAVADTAVTLPPSALTKQHLARRAAAARLESAADAREPTRHEVATPVEATALDTAVPEKKRPSSLRAIDEADPFK